MPVASPVLISTWDVSTPALVRDRSSRSPLLSSPTAPIIRTFPPKRAAATAWFAPLPPGRTVRSPPGTVSPGCGNLAICTVKSALSDPTMMIDPGSRSLTIRTPRK